MYLGVRCQYRSNNFFTELFLANSTQITKLLLSSSSRLFSPSAQHQPNWRVLKRQVLSQPMNQVAPVTLRHFLRRVDKQRKSRWSRSSLCAIVEFYRLALRQRRCVSSDDLLQCLIHRGGRNFFAICPQYNAGRL